MSSDLATKKMILIATLFINSAVFADASDSPRRLPHQVHCADSVASSSGRKFEDLLSDTSNFRKKGGMSFSELLTNFQKMQDEYNSYWQDDDKGIFYEENGNYYPVKRGMPLLAFKGHLVGRSNNGYFSPIFNSAHDTIMSDEGNCNKHHIFGTEYNLHALDKEPIPPEYRVVHFMVPHDRKGKVLANAHEVNVQSDAPTKNSGKSAKRGNKKTV